MSVADDQMRIAIIGTGGIAGMHAGCLRDIPGVEVVGLCDIVPGKAEKFGRRHGYEGARTYLNHRDLLKGVKCDAAIVATYNSAHSVVTVDCLNAGIPVLCEKPMSVTLAEAVAMERAARKAKLVLSIGFQPRFDPNMKMIRDVVQSGVLGKVYYIETGGGRRRGIPGGTFIKKELAGVGAIADIGCYSLDMVLHALGYPKPLTVSAYRSDFFGKNPKYSPDWKPSEFDVEDFGVAMVRLEGGAVLYFKISWAMHMDTLGPTLFLGTEAGLKCTDQGVTMFHDLPGGYMTQSPLPTQRCSYERMFTEKIRAFLKAVREGSESPVPGSEIVINQAIIDGIVRSCEAGREVDIVIPALG